MFTREVFPLLERLCDDSNQEVRIASVSQIPEIATKFPDLFTKQGLEELYMRFLDAKNEDIWKLTYKFIGRMLVSIKGIDIDSPVVQKYIQIGMKSRSNEVLYDCAYNFPAFIVTFRDRWEEFEQLYIRLCETNSVAISKTLACSAHEFIVSELVPKEVVEDILVPFMLDSLSSKHEEVRNAAIKYLHQFLQKVEDPKEFLPLILKVGKLDT